MHNFMQLVATSASHPVLELTQTSYYRARCYDAAAGRFLIEDSQDLNTEEPLATMGRTLVLAGC